MKRSIKFFVKFSVLAIAVVALCTFDSYAATTSSKTVVVNNKTSQFDEVFSDLGAKTADTTSADLADRIRRQRALLDNKGKADTTGGAKSSGVTGANACDATLRKCMAEKCGSDFTKCSKDSTTIWGEKMDSCRRKTNCSGHEYALLAPEILADRDFNERMSYYNSVISCGNQYNRCIFAECGATLEKCLSKSDGDRAVSKCESVAKECKEQDSGLAARVMSVFSDLRTVAQKQVKVDEARLYELRDLMRAQCNRFGAMFDERTLDCVYTVNFFAGDNTSTPTASKKLYAGDSFTCTPNWFGIDVTTFKENAYRLTRSQTAASSAMLGAGAGVAAGLISSGAIGRALDTQKAEKAAKEECENSGFTWEKGACNKNKPNDKVGNGNGGEGGNEDDECPAGQHRDDAGNCVADEQQQQQQQQEQPNCDEVCATATATIQNFINENKFFSHATLSNPTCKNACKEAIRSLCEGLNGKQYKGKTVTNPYPDIGTYSGGRAEVFCNYDIGNSSSPIGNDANMQNVISSAIKCNMYNNSEENCKKLVDKCEWRDGKCQDIQTENPNANPDNTPVTSGNSGKATQVNINLNVATRAETPVTGNLVCKYNGKSKTEKIKDGRVSAKKMPSDAECTISSSAPTCSPLKKTAQEFSELQSVTMECQAVNKCISEGKVWTNNKCSSGAGSAVNTCDMTPQAICGQGNQRGRCEWDGTQCVQKKNSPIAPTPAQSNGTPSNGSGNGGTSTACNSDFTALANSLKMDTPIDLSNCDSGQINTGKQILGKACYNKYNATLVLRSDNKTVANHRVTPIITSDNKFVCQLKDWWTFKDPNARIGKPEEWDTETHPSKEECASTCAQIKPITDPTKNILAFPGNKQCLKVCTPNIETACKGLIGKKYGDADITKINIVFTVNSKNVLEYHCEYTYRK